MSAFARRPKPAESASIGGSEAIERSDSVERETQIGESTETAAHVLSVDEIVARYEGEWVLMKVSAFEDGWPSRGELLAHSPSRQVIAEADARLVGYRPTPDATYSVFQAYRYIRNGAEMRKALEEARQTGAKGAWRRW